LNEPDNLSVVFRGTRALCREYSLVLESKAIEHNVLEGENGWILAVPPELFVRAEDELARYAAEPSVSAPTPIAPRLYAGASIGSVAYTLILLLAAYAAGQHLFDADWYSAGEVDAGTGRGEWWRAVTALTLHVDPEHLFGNLFSGIIVGAAATRLVGPGVAWGIGCLAGALGNLVEMWIAPVSHRAIGASTAVFALLGLLTGLAWSERMQLRERMWYRWAPLIAGICLLSFFGAGGEHVDVLGHLLGFLFGVAAGWLYPYAGISRNHGMRVQIAMGICTLCLIALAWFLALRRPLALASAAGG
jgi:rhomboid protease GluP